MAKKGRNNKGGPDGGGGSGGGRKAWRAAEERKLMAHAYQDVARWRRAQQEKQRPLHSTAKKKNHPWLPSPTHPTRRVGLTQLRGLLEERRWEDRRLDREQRLLRMMRLRGSLSSSSSLSCDPHARPGTATTRQGRHEAGWLLFDSSIGTSRISKQSSLLSDGMNGDDEEGGHDAARLRQGVSHWERTALGMEKGDSIPSLQVMAALALGPVLQEYVEACGPDMMRAVLGGLPTPLLSLLSVTCSRSARGMTAPVAAVLGSASIHIEALCFRQASTFSSSAEDEEEEDCDDEEKDVEDDKMPRRHERGRRLGGASRFITNETLLDIMPQLIQGQPDSECDNDDEIEKPHDTALQEGKNHSLEEEIHDWEDLLGDDNSEDDDHNHGAPSSGSCSYYHHWALDVSALSWTGCCYLQRLELVNVKHVSTDVFLTFCKACSRLTHLSIANSFSSVSGPPLLIRADGGTTLMEVVPTLEALDVSFCQWVTEGVLQAWVERWMRASSSSSSSTWSRWVGLSGCPAAPLAHQWNLQQTSLELCTTPGRSPLGLESLYRLFASPVSKGLLPREEEEEGEALLSSGAAARTTTTTGHVHRRQPWAAQPRRSVLGGVSNAGQVDEPDEDFILCHV